MDILISKLEEIKQAGNYAVSLHYGEDIGCDDLDVPVEERKLQIVSYPVGFLGNIKIMYVGNLKDIVNLDPRSEPKFISNPPKREEYEDNGWYAWGSKDSVESFMARFEEEK